MKKYFNVNFEFDKKNLERVIKHTAKKSKGYCCFIDLTALVYSHNHKGFKNTLNGAIVNSCDGSYIAMMASKIYNENLKQYTGPNFLKKFIFEDGKHIILGSKLKVYDKLLKRIEKKESNINNFSYLSLPFKSADEFDYKSIAKHLNNEKANYIWISLGAPKQEYFMEKLLPYIDRGMLLGVGAALNYFSGEIKDIPKWIEKFNLIWVYRFFTEPRKQTKRLKNIFITFPKMIREEKKKIK